jgi:hypothetical protein
MVPEFTGYRFVDSGRSIREPWHPSGQSKSDATHADLWVVALVDEHDLSTAGVIKERLAGGAFAWDSRDSRTLPGQLRGHQCDRGDREGAPTRRQQRGRCLGGRRTDRIPAPPCLGIVQLSGVRLSERRAEAYEAMQEGTGA